MSNKGSFIPILALLCLLIFCGCKSATSLNNQKISPSYNLLEPEEGKNRITQDEVDLFFNKIGSLDMRLQMPLDAECQNRSQCLSMYQDHLRESVEAFTNKEKELLISVMDSCISLIKGISPDLKIPHIDLIKIDINHYGPSVYYTRENAILIPNNELISGTISSLLPVMLHEYSHIILRYHDQLKKEAYGLIGFQLLNKDIKYAEEINQRLLHNPDGLDNRFYINITIKERHYKAVPVLVSTQSEPTNKINGFMNYIKFDLYELEDKGDHFLVRSDENGFTTLPADGMKSFFNQIKENTQYIIHPDEIIADNFMMLILATRDGTLDNFNDEGQKLLADLKSKLMN